MQGLNSVMGMSVGRCCGLFWSLICRGVGSVRLREIESSSRSVELICCLLGEISLSYEADTKSLSCRCRLFLLFSPVLRTPIGQQWYQVIGKQKKSIRMSCRREHDQERVLVSASYCCASVDSGDKTSTVTLEWSPFSLIF